jgi:hypothetical protein
MAKARFTTLDLSHHSLSLSLSPHGIILLTMLQAFFDVISFKCESLIQLPSHAFGLPNVILVRTFFKNIHVKAKGS